MNVRTKALIETAKIAGLFLVAMVAIYTILNILGPTLGLILLSVSILGYFLWLTYDYYASKFRAEETFKN